MQIRTLEDEELEAGFALIWEVFQEFVAPDYSQEGIDTFYTEFVQSKMFRERFATRKEIMYGAYMDNELAGVLSISRNNYVSCVFVRGKFHRRVVGKKLFEVVINELRRRGVEKISLNASPYAVPFYRHIGFTDTGEQSDYKGIVSTPMELEI